MKLCDGKQWSCYGLITVEYVYDDVQKVEWG